MLGSILIQPQMLDRMHGRGVGDEMADEIVAIAHQLSLDPAAAEAVLPAFQAAGQRFADTLLARLGPRLPQALTELRGGPLAADHPVFLPPGAEGRLLRDAAPSDGIDQAITWARNWWNLP